MSIPLKKIKEVFLDFIGTVSVEELAFNRRLQNKIASILELIEKMKREAIYV